MLTMLSNELLRRISSSTCDAFEATDCDGSSWVTVGVAAICEMSPVFELDLLATDRRARELARDVEPILEPWTCCGVSGMAEVEEVVLPPVGEIISDRIGGTTIEGVVVPVGIRLA